MENNKNDILLKLPIDKNSEINKENENLYHKIENDFKPPCVKNNNVDKPYLSFIKLLNNSINELNFNPTEFLNFKNEESKALYNLE